MKKIYTLEEIKDLINKKINNDIIYNDDDTFYYEIDARKALKEYSENDPDNKELLFMLGLMEYDSNYIEEAEKIFAKLLDSNYQKDKVMYYLASLYYKDSSIYHFSAKINIQEICKLIENAIELNNNDSEYWYLLGGINLYTNRDYNKALYYYKKAYKINHSEIIKNHKEKYYYTFGKVNLYLGNYDAAIEIFKKTIKNFRESEYFKYSISRHEEANYIHYLGLSYEKNEQYDEAIKSYEKSWHIYQGSCIDIECYRYHRQHIIKSIYDLYKKVGKNREAIQFLKASILYDISYPLKIIPLDIEEKDFKGSEAYNDIVQAYTLRIEERSFYGMQYIMPCREKLADFYKTYKEYDKAEELYKIISIESYKNIARMYAEDENYDKAIDTYKTIIQIYPDDSSCYSDIAYIYEEIKNYEEAINYYNKSFEKGNLSCSRRIAEFYENINEYSKAIYFYTKYIDFSKNDFYVLKNIANLYNKLNDIENRNLYYEKIADILKEFIQNDVYDEYDIERYLEEIESIYLEIGEKEKLLAVYDIAIGVFEERLYKHGECYCIYQYLGDIYFKIDYKEKALENYNKAIELLIKKIDEYRNISKLDAYKKIDFHYISYLSNLALLFEKVSRDDECIPIYEELIKIYEDKIADDGEHVFYLKTVAEFYMKLNQKDNALKMYEKILEIDADNDETDEAKEKIRSIKLEK